MISVGDWLIGCMNPERIEGDLILIKGCQDMELWRPVISMILGIVGTVLLVPVLVSFQEFIKEEYQKERRVYGKIMILGALPWMLIHFVFVVFRAMYKLIFDLQGAQSTYEITYGVLKYFYPLIYGTMMLIMIPHLFYTVLMVQKKTIFPYWTFSFYFVPVKVVFDVIGLAARDRAFGKGMMTASNNMAITVWMIGLIIYFVRQKSLTKS